MSTTHNLLPKDSDQITKLVRVNRSTTIFIKLEIEYPFCLTKDGAEV